jgi:energy-coupling factor transport system permease protein
MSLDILSSFNFIEKQNIFHKMDPRSKIFMLLVYMILLFMFENIVFQLIILLSLFPLILMSEMIKNIFKSLRGSTFIFFFIIFFNTVFINFNLGIQMSLRLMNIMITFSLFFQTTNPEDLTQSFTKMGVPFHLSYSLSLAFRFIPTLANEMENIVNAQKSRGYSSDIKE